MGSTLIGSFVVNMVLRVPVGFALAAASLFSLWLLTDVPLSIGAQRILSGITPFALLAIPLFIIAGAVMNAGGMTRRLLDLADSIVGGLRGGLAQTNVLSSLFFGGVSGSAVADISSLGKILIPAMKSRNYRGAFAAAVTAVAPVVVPVMPPSIAMILYGVVSGTSIGELFFAGIIPGLLYIALMMFTVHLVVRKQGFNEGESERRIDASVQPERPRFWASLYRAVPALVLPLVILLGIRFGVFTPTEAASVAVVYAVAVGFFFYRELTWRKLVHAVADSAILLGLIMLVLAAAQLFSWAMSTAHIPQQAAQAVASVTDNPVVLLLLLNLLLLVVGMFIEANAALMIMTPILMPIALSIGVDPVHLGVIMIANLGIGLVTPPVGIATMLSAEIAGVKLISAFKASLPFLVAGGLFILLITFVPQISLWLPSILLP